MNPGPSAKNCRTAGGRGWVPWPSRALHGGDGGRPAGGWRFWVSLVEETVGRLKKCHTHDEETAMGVSRGAGNSRSYARSEGLQFSQEAEDFMVLLDLGVEGRVLRFRR